MPRTANWAQLVAEATYATTSAGEWRIPDPAEAEKTARKTVKVKSPSGYETIKLFCADPEKAWYLEVNRYAISTGMAAADTAWKNWLNSLAGRRAGARIGYPRFKAKGRARDSFRLHHDVKRPTLRPDGYRRLNLPAKAGGSIRLKGNLRQLARRINRGTAVIQSVTISRHGQRWYASVLAKETVPAPVTTKRQQAAGTIGVDLGVTHLAALSDGTLVTNPRHARNAARRVKKAQQALARSGWRLTDGELVHDVKDRRRRTPTSGRLRAQARLAKALALVAEQRATTLHTLTKRLAIEYAVVAIEDLNVAGMTSSARGTLEAPGRNVRAKAGLNRSVLDVAPGEFRRQLTYKTSWYGSRVAVIDRWAPTSKTCSACGAVKAKLGLSERTYRCDCGLVMDRDVNAARNIARLADTVLDDASGTGESINARGGSAPPQRGADPPKREGRPPRKRRGHRDPAKGRPSTRHLKLDLRSA